VVTSDESGEGVPAGDATDEQLWPMGAVTRRTGIGEHTLRAWEKRFGFPTPLRLDSGHRRYTAAQVRQLLLISRALDSGHRAGDVVPLSTDELEVLVRGAGTVNPTMPTAGIDESVAEVIEACRRFDRETLVATLRRDATVLGMARFLRERVAPLLEEIGSEWSRGGIEIRHEHFFSEVLEDELRLLRVPLQVAAGGRPVVLASLPNEIHGLGLQIAALEITIGGRSVRVLGSQLPPQEIVSAAETLNAAAVGLSMSLFASVDETERDIAIIREALPRSIEMWVGGAGSACLQRMPDGVKAVTTLDELDRAVNDLPR
jgi:methanogenic corrinoid protein MtbC1